MAVRKGARCNSATPQVAGEIDGLIGIVSQLNEGIAPKERDMSAFSDLYKLFMKRCEDFHKVETMGSEPGVLNFVRKTLRGTEAVKHTYQEVMRVMETNPDSVTLETLRPLKTFAWVLAPSEQQVLRDWVAAAVARRAPLRCLAIADDGTTPPGSTLVAQGASASAPGAKPVSCRGSGPSDILQQKMSSMEGQADFKSTSETGEATKAMVMQFFYKRGST